MGMDGLTETGALATSFADAARDCGRMSDELDQIACELEPLDEQAAAMAGSHAIDGAHLEIRLGALADKLHAALRRG
jgi:hypothetical protein